MRPIAPLVLVLATPGAAAAQAPEHFVASLSVDDAAGCLDEATLTREVEQRLERRVFSRSAPEAHLSVRVARADPLQASILLTRADGSVVGTRELIAPGDCARLLDALALVIALLVDLPATEVRLQLPPPPPPARPGPLLLAEARPELALGVFPSVTAGLGMALAGQSGGLLVGLEASLWPRSQASLGSGREATLSALSAGLFGCGSLRRGEWASVGGCLHVGAGRASARGQGFDEDRSASAYRVDVGALLRASLRIKGPIWLSLGVGPVFTPTPVQLVVEGADGQRHELLQGGRVWGRGYLGLGMLFPSKP